MMPSSRCMGCTMAVMYSWMVILVPIMRSTCMSAYFMEFNPIMWILFFPIETDIREIEPDREKCGIHQVGKKKLVEHEHDSKRQDEVLSSHDIPEEMWSAYGFSVEETIFEEDEYGSHLEYIGLFHHIGDNGRHTEKKRNWCQEVLYGIECGVCWLRDDQSGMKWEKHSEYKDQVDRYTDDNHRKSKWEESSLTSKCLVPKEENREEDIDTKPNNSPKSCLKDVMKREEIVEYNGNEKNAQTQYHIKWRNRKCISKRLDKFHRKEEL